MSNTDILFIVQYETGVKLSEMKESRHTPRLFAKYLAIIMLHEKGEPATIIARLFDSHRTAIYMAIPVINNLLAFDKLFKHLYANCMAKKKEMEGGVL